MRLYRPNTFRVIFLVPVAAYASQGGGCASTPDQGVLKQEQVVEILAGNTVQSEDQKSFAFVGKDGSLRGLNIASGGKTGEWRVSDNNVLCAKWNEAPGSPENCDVLRYVGDNDYQWAGNTLRIVKGNPKNL